MKKIAVLVSGSGTNMQNIAEYFNKGDYARVTIVLSNNPDAYAIERAKKLDVPCVVFNKEDFYDTDKILDLLIEEEVDIVVLAGFLWLIPLKFIIVFPFEIINIHPALLPNYGGKGMYGMKVHEAIIAAKEKQSGITIHYVNERYDEGSIIFQAFCDIVPEDTADDLAHKIHNLEQIYFPGIIDHVLKFEGDTPVRL